MVKLRLAILELCLRKKYFLYACNHKDADKEAILKFKMFSRTGLWPVSIFVLMTNTK